MTAYQGPYPYLEPSDAISTATPAVSAELADVLDGPAPVATTKDSWTDLSGRSTWGAVSGSTTPSLALNTPSSWLCLATASGRVSHSYSTTSTEFALRMRVRNGLGAWVSLTDAESFRWRHKSTTSLELPFSIVWPVVVAAGPSSVVAELQYKSTGDMSEWSGIYAFTTRLIPLRPVT